VALSAVILAQVAVDQTHAWAAPANALPAAFLDRVGSGPQQVVDHAVAIRKADRGLTPDEADRLDEAAALVTDCG
jgi:hypothetical protein